MERIEDRSKALSYIGIEIAEALKYIPAPLEDIQNAEVTNGEDAGVTNPILQAEENAEGGNVEETINDNAVAAETTDVANETETVDTASAEDTYFEETRFEVKPTLWQRFKNSKFVRTLRYIMQIKVVLEYPALPEGNGENY